MTKTPGNRLDAAHLMNVAAESAVLNDFGDLSFVEPLRQRLAAAGRYVSFSETGRFSPASPPNGQAASLRERQIGD